MPPSLPAPDRDGLVVPLDGGGVTPAQAGPKAAALARLSGAGLPVPAGLVLTADAYRAQLAAAGLVPGADRGDDPRSALRARLACLREIEPAIAGPLVAAWARLAGPARHPVAVRSSALLEGGPRVAAAGQFETFLGIGDAADLLTAVRACWSALWSVRARRYLRDRGVDPAGTAMAVLIQRLVPARAAGGALSRTADGTLVLTAAWGLGPAVAQGEVVPDRYVLAREGPALRSLEPGRKPRRLVLTARGAEPRWEAVPPERVASPCLDPAEALSLAHLVLAAEAAFGTAVELEWALDDAGFHLLQARPLPPASRGASSRASALEPGARDLRGQPAGAGRAVGPVSIVRREADLAAVGVGDVLVTRVAGPALAGVLPRVAAVVAELGGSTSHLAALARERGIPAVLGVADATRRIPEGARVVVDGATGVVRWSR